MTLALAVVSRNTLGDAGAAGRGARVDVRAGYSLMIWNSEIWPAGQPVFAVTLAFQ